jgi:WD40 repeat protein
LTRSDSHVNWVRSGAFSPNGTRLAAASSRNTAGVWDATTGEVLLTVQHSKWVTGVASSPDGTRLATASADKTERISEIPAITA